jgi:hypothetical protein
MGRKYKHRAKSREVEKNGTTMSFELLERSLSPLGTRGCTGEIEVHLAFGLQLRHQERHLSVGIAGASRAQVDLRIVLGAFLDP